MNVRQMMVEANSKKIKIDSDKIVELAFEMDENKEVSNDEYQKIFQEYLKRIDKGIPFEAKDYVSTDDVVKVMQNLTAIMARLKTTADKNKLISLIRKDAKIEDIEKYFEENGIKDTKKVKTSKGKLTTVKQKDVGEKSTKKPVKTTKGKLTMTTKKRKFNGVVR